MLLVSEAARQSSMTKRAIFYDDGFNLYHAIDDLNKNHLKWLDLRALAELVIPKKDEHVENVIFFSAIPSHLGKKHPHKIARHNVYVKALEASGVECILGRFKTKIFYCHKCKNKWQSAEEKETDVHIACRLLEDAFLDRFDVAYLISNDTDLVPAIKIFKNNFPNKEIVGLVTPGRNYATDLKSVVDRTQKMTPKLLSRCLLSAKIKSNPGGVIMRPRVYDPPNT